MEAGYNIIIVVVSIWMLFPCVLQSANTSLADFVKVSLRGGGWGGRGYMYLCYTVENFVACPGFIFEEISIVKMSMRTQA